MSEPLNSGKLIKNEHKLVSKAFDTIPYCSQIFLGINKCTHGGKVHNLSKSRLKESLSVA